MGLEEDFESRRTRPPRQKVTLGGKKTPAAVATLITGSPSATNTTAAVASALPLITVSSGSDQVAGRAKSVRGKDKAPAPEGAPPTKRPRPSGTSSRTPILDALVGGDGHPGDLMHQLDALFPDVENIKEWETTLVAEKGARELLQLSRTVNDLFCRTKAGERLYHKEVEANKKALARREAQIQELAKRAEAAESKVATTVSDYKDSLAFFEDAVAAPVQLAEKVFGTPSSSEAFFRAMLKTRWARG